LLAELARQARAIQPLDTNMVANLDIVIDKVSLGYNDTGAFMATNKRQLGGNGPVTVDCMKICVAHTRELDINKNLIWTWLLDWNVLVLDRTASLLDDLGLLGLWDVLRHCD
jgi:hypothetical protein